MNKKHKLLKEPTAAEHWVPIWRDYVKTVEAKCDSLAAQLETCKAAHMGNCLDADKLRAQNRELLAVVVRVDELSEAFDLQTDKGRCALANEIRILGVAARTLSCSSRR